MILRAKTILPLTLLLLGTWLLIGCIYLPIPEHRAAGTRSKDLRTEITRWPLHRGLTRAEIIGRLGPPARVSKDGLALAYTYDTEFGLWIEPLCFMAFPDGYRQVSLGFLFDDKNVLIDWDIEERVAQLGPEPIKYVQTVTYGISALKSRIADKFLDNSPTIRP